jgi:hypothetical protein
MPVIDGVPQRRQGQRVAHERAQERQRKESVGDRRLVRRFGCRARRVDVNPLVIASRVGKLVDALL